MSIRTHSLEVASGEEIDSKLRVRLPVSTSEQDTLYSGRICHLGTAGDCREGATGTDLPFVASRGVECADVGGVAAIASGQTGYWAASSGVDGYISCIPMRSGAVVLTTEYITTDSYTPGAKLTCNTADGQFRLNDNNGEQWIYGYVVTAPASVNYDKNRNVLKLMLAWDSPNRS